MPESNENQEQNGQPKGHGGFNWRTFLLLTLGIIVALVGMLAYRIATDSPPPPPDRGGEVQPGAPDGEPEVDTDAVRTEAWQRIQPRLEAADAKTRELTNQLVHRIETFFDSRKEGARAFGEAALGWKSKWELIKSRDGHREFIAARFSEYIFTQDELAALLKEASDEYAQGLRAVENELLVQVRADLKNLPASALPAFANKNVLESRFDNIVATVAADVARDLQVDVGREITSFAVGEIVAVVVKKTLTAVVTRLGISGAILGTGAASSWATFGAGIVICIAVDFLLDWIIGWFHDPAGDIANKVTASLDDVKTSITTGDPDAWKAHDRIEQMATEHSDPAMRTKAAKVLANIERGGALGLKYALGKVADVQNRSRELALKQLVFEEGQQ